MSNSNDSFTVKDSGARANLGGGVRDTEENKVDYTLVRDGVMYKRYADHLTKGARKYAARNWLKFFESRESALAAFQRAGRSLLRHTEDYLKGIRDEDHAAAMIFNLDVREKALSIYPGLTDTEETPAEETVKSVSDRKEDSSSPDVFAGPRGYEPSYRYDGCRYQLTGEFRPPVRGEVILVRSSKGDKTMPMRTLVNYPEGDGWNRPILRKIE